MAVVAIHLRRSFVSGVADGAADGTGVAVVDCSCTIATALDIDFRYAVSLSIQLCSPIMPRTVSVAA